ncbi:hypothetical protein QWE_17613 [Agrobacterium albertimagni AOL15]|uniref:Uncharacterized protein n=1 Tax=Agrobacterium albertimagni AOL15 TaxID=1156935 RepID=K2PC26_9HYPH|nr:hypothetical protein QWE_17613 [Agrobacterium albertimagni AOL15]
MFLFCRKKPNTIQFHQKEPTEVVSPDVVVLHDCESWFTEAGVNCNADIRHGCRISRQIDRQIGGAGFAAAFPGKATMLCAEAIRHRKVPSTVMGDV